MQRSSLPPPASAGLTFDLDLIAQRILKMAEIATLEHLDAVARSQAHSLLHHDFELPPEADASHPLWR